MSTTDSPEVGVPTRIVNVILRASSREQRAGGGGLILAGRDREKDGLVLHLVPSTADGGAEARLQAVADDLNRSRGLRAQVHPRV